MYQLLVLLFIFFLLYLTFNNNNEKYTDEIDNYYFKDVNSLKRDKRFIWIHISDNLKEYQKLCIKSIINKCNKNYNIILFKDDDINSLLYKDEAVDFKSLAGSDLEIYRNICFLKILNEYGGVFLPSYFYLIKSIKYIDTNTFYVSQITNQRKHVSLNPMIHSIEIMGSNSNNPILRKYIDNYSKNCLNNLTNECISFGNDLLKEMDIPHIDGKILGCKDINDEVIYLEDLMEDKNITLDKNNIGLYIPHHELIRRTNYNWYSYLNQKELLKVNVYLSKYLQQ